MNAEIIRILEREFPEPWTLEERVHQLHGLIAMLTNAMPKDAVEELGKHVRDTLTATAVGRMTDVDEETRSAVLRALAKWEGDALGDNRDAEQFFSGYRT